MPVVHTPVGILSFPNLFKPRPRSPGADPVYSCSLLFDQAAQRHPLFALMKKAVDELVDQTWGAGKSQDPKFMARIRSPFRSCSDKDYKGYDIPGGVYISPWSNNKPGIIDARKQEILVPDDVWPGQLARLTVNPFSYDQPGNPGVNFGLNNIQVCGPGAERLDGRKSAADEFNEYSGPGAG